MKFELDYKNIHFIMTVENETNFIPDDRFERLSPQTLIDLKKKEILPYSLHIQATSTSELELTFFISSILLSSNSDEILEELQEYLDHENIIEDICEAFERDEKLKDGPAWKI